MLRGLKSRLCKFGLLCATIVAVAAAGEAHAQSVTCPVDWAKLKQKLVSAAGADTTGLDNDFWAVVVNREGTVCAVAYSGAGVGSQWLLSRQIAAAKAFTANGLSLDSDPISTGALYSFVLPIVPPDQPSPNPLYGLFAGNIMNAQAAFAGPYERFGTSADPMVGQRVGGTITFGGGLGLYQGTTAVGGLGLSGDTACADHSVAYRLRTLLALVPADDRLGLDKITLSPQAHPHCPNDAGTRGTK